jgi:hypothetical protein
VRAATADRSTGSSDVRGSAFQRLLKAALPGLFGEAFCLEMTTGGNGPACAWRARGGRAAVRETAARGWVSERRNQNVTRRLSSVLTKRDIKLAE